ncbi:exonuclease [Cutibacterium avidum]|nr:DNA polymerase [Cutibacterium avidum 44067]EPH05728.1 hypothetical protein HMPREF1485_00363 [Propionibacterium sp. HGH0353]MCO6671103.1 exonuclease [Cutibacterium avidum]MCO6672937.1 exonuclease [Cutibacterium avidum]PGX70051.1 exonuclease [Cutibacterium avidum]
MASSMTVPQWLRRLLRHPERATPKDLRDLSAMVDDSDRIVPMYRGRDNGRWRQEIAALKREGDYEQALVLASGCMFSMFSMAQEAPDTADESWVIEVAKILRRMRYYPEEARTIEFWLNLGIESSRIDEHLDLWKRRARAQELWAKVEGRDATEYHEEWRRLVEAGRRTKDTMSLDWTVVSQPPAPHAVAPIRKGRATRTPRHSKLIPSPEQMACGTFVAVDFETANRQGGVSACQLAMVRVSEGRIVDRFNSLLRPPPGWDAFQFTYLHGISAADVQHSPMWPEIADEISEFVADSPVYAHNAMFDSRVWRQLDEYFGTVTLPSPFFCSYRTAQRLIRGLPNYKLPTVLQACEPNYHLNHHRADSDAEACALIVCQLQRLASQL